MRYAFKCFLAALFLFLSLGEARAGFLIRKTQTTTYPALVTNLPPVVTASPALSVAINDNDHRDHPKRKPSESGWEGIVALVCGLVFCPILAIIFGALGMGNGHKHKDLALAGLIIGIVEMLLIGFFVVLSLGMF